MEAHTLASTQTDVVTVTTGGRDTGGSPPHVRPRTAGDSDLDACTVDEMRQWQAEAAVYVTERLGPLASAIVRAFPGVRHALHIRALAGDAAPPAAPYAGYSDTRRIPSTVACAVGVIELMGARPFAYANENDGRLVRDVVARVGATDELSSQGWRRTLPWHMDGACRPLHDRPAGACGLAPAPRWLVFGVIYDEPRIPITFAPLHDVVASLDDQTVEVLSSPEFDVHSPESFEGSYVAERVPILLPWAGGDFVSRYNEAKCVGRTPRARRALATLTDTLEHPALAQTIDIRAGDVVVLDNWRALHMREAYTPRWDGRDRWLIRIYAAPADVQGTAARPTAPWVWR